MSFQIITGAHSCGKTEKLFSNFIASALQNPTKKHIVIAPEQSTLLVERRLLDMLRERYDKRVLFNIDVLSFNKVAYLVMDKCDVKAPEIMDSICKSMLVRKALRKSKKDLKLYTNSADKHGFVAMMTNMISELIRYGVTSEMLEESASKAESGNLRAKLSDLKLVFDAFNSIREKGKIVKEELLPLGLDYIAQSKVFDGAYVVFDGFSGFTPPQYDYIEEILRYADKAIATLTISGDENPFDKPEPHELFAITKNTARSLQDTAQKAGVKTEHIKLSNEPLAKKPEELNFLSKHFLRHDVPKDSRYKNKKNYSERAPKSSGAVFEALTLNDAQTTAEPIKLVSCTNPAEEAAYVTHEIHKLVREKNLKYRDIAVVTDALDKNKECLEYAFNKAGIPCFIDAKRDVMGHPLTVFTLGALEVIEKGFSFDSVFRFLKTGLGSIKGNNLDELENYVLATGIRGKKKWEEPFVKDGYKDHMHVNLERINENREKAIRPLLNFKDAYDARKDAGDIIGAIKKLYDECKVETKLGHMSEDFTKISNEGAGAQVSDFDISKAGVYEQIFEKFIQILDEFKDMFGDMGKMSAKEVRELLTAGFSCLKVGLLPPTIDEVHVGDVKRSHRGKIKALFFIDFNEGIVPKIAEGGILLDEDRSFLASYGIELAPSVKQATFEEQFYIYELLSTPTENLYITSSRLDLANGKLAPSIYYNYVMELFDDMHIESYDGIKDFIDIGELFDRNEALAYLSENYNTRDEKLKEKVKALYNDILAKEKSSAENIERAATFDYDKDYKNLDPETIARLYEELRGSVSRLETQAACPYRHFLNYGLGLKERPVFDFNNFDRGLFFHKVFEEVYKNVDTGILTEISTLNTPEVDDKGKKKTKKIDLDSPQIQTLTSEVEKYLDSAVEEAKKAISSKELFDTPAGRYKLARWEKIARHVVLASLENIGDGFVPRDFEYSFGGRGDSETPYEVELEDGKIMKLSGQVDRIDVADGEDKKLRIVDYKTYSNKLDHALVSKGIQLQLLTYLGIILDNETAKDKKVIAEQRVGYYEIADKKVPADIRMTTEDIREKDVDIYKYKDEAISSDEIDITKAQVVRLGNEIYEGNIKINPYDDEKGHDSCSFCIYKDICRFDEKLKGFKMRKL